jgi:hypothetical protein
MKGDGNLVSWMNGPKMRAKIVSLLVAAVSALALGACGESEIRVEIRDQEARAKYIQVLEKNGIDYRMDNEGILHVTADPGRLESEMKEYDEWRKERDTAKGIKYME